MLGSPDQGVLTLAELYFHYTSGNAFTDIVRSKSFWLTNGRFLNDPMDCNDRNDELESLANVHLSGDLKDVFLSMTKHTVDAYVASFGRSGDSLLHWRAYGDDGAGVALGYDPDLLTGTVKSEQGYRVDPKTMLGTQPVTYSRVKLNNFLELAFESTASKMSKGGNINSLAVQLFLTAKTFLCGYKHESWAGEEEARLLHLALPNAIPALQRGFRVNRGNLYDYAVAPYPIEALKTVSLGPKCLFEVSMVDRYLTSLGYTDFSVKKSDLLYR